MTAWSKKIMERTATTKPVRAIVSQTARIGLSSAQYWKTEVYKTPPKSPPIQAPINRTPTLDHFAAAKPIPLPIPVHTIRLSQTAQ